MGLDSYVKMWATAISTNEHNNRKIIFRYAKQLSETFDRNSQPIRIIIAWEYISEWGQPNPEDHQRMNLLEDALKSVFNGDISVTLALVSTGEDLREWIYYTKSENEFMLLLNDALGEMPAFPIEIHVASDPTWETYERFKAGVKEVAN